MLLTGWLLLIPIGCNSLQRTAEQVASFARGGSDAPDPEATPEEPETVTAIDPQVLNALASGGWVATVPATNGAAPANRWRHPMLESLPPQEHVADFRAALSSTKPVVAANAALALARYAGEASEERLEPIVRERSSPLPVRLAASESLGKLDRPAASDCLMQLLNDLASREHFSKPHYVPDVHTELLYALASRGTGQADWASRQQHFVAALASPAATVRLAAARAWLAVATAPLPEELLDRRTDPDPRVRVAVLEAIAMRRLPQAGEHLASALADSDVQVRLAAVRGLGKLADDASLKDLRRLAGHDAELIRAAAVASLAERGDFDNVFAAAEDASWNVRLAVARMLADPSDQRSKTLAARLLVDASPHVRTQMAASLGKWPLEQAGPLLLAAMGQNSYLVRKAAREELSKRWPAAEALLVDAPAESRKAKLAALEAQWRTEFNAEVVEDAVRGAVQEATRDGDAVNTSGLRLDAHTNDHLADLKSPDLLLRRRAADLLAQQAGKGPLSAEAVETLCGAIIAEPDTLVWRSALSAVAGDTGEAARRLAYAGLSHPAAEVRRRACEHLLANPDQRHAEVLIKSLEDAEPQVVRAALQALAACGATLNPAPLERLLSATDKSLRVEAAETLARWKASSGSAALERLALDADPAVRRMAAAAMGRLGDEAFVPSLMQLLDDQGGVRQSALVSLTQIAGADMARTADTEPPTSSLEEVRRWRDWHKQRQ